jgi:hypothetical protein
MSVYTFFLLEQDRVRVASFHAADCRDDMEAIALADRVRVAQRVCCLEIWDERRFVGLRCDGGAENDLCTALD